MSSETALLRHALQAFCSMDEASFALSEPFWQRKEYAKGAFRASILIAPFTTAPSLRAQQSNLYNTSCSLQLIR